jgi:putative thioredoxin
LTQIATLVTPLFPAAGNAGGSVKTKLIYNVDESNFDMEVIEKSRSVPVVVDFWADWCPPCKQLNPVLERVIKSLKGTAFLAKIEIDDNMHLAGRYKLSGFPSVLLFQNGQEVERFAGARSEIFVREFIQRYLKKARSG